MWVWGKTAAVLGLSVLLMGSKIIIQVPPGGSIVSTTGLFACSAGELCTIEVNERHFAETFTAVAEPGYVFDSWGDGAREVCRGSHNAYCEELDRDVFAEFEPAGVKLRAGNVLTLTPSFAADGQLEATPTVPFIINSLHTTRYYDVAGNTQEEIWDHMHGPANPLAADRHAGVKPVAHADFYYKYNFSSKPGSSPSSCRVASGKLTFRFETVLPQLAAGSDTSEQLKYRWLSFQAKVTEHEAGHHAIYRQLVTELPQLMTGLGETSCSELAATVELQVASAVEAVRQASIDYDEHHGSETYVAASF